MKFYDKGFIIKYPNYTQIEILNSGNSIIKLDLYENRICSSTFKCLSNSSFNKEYLNKDYKDTFLKELFEKEGKKVVFRDKESRVLIKIIKD